MPLDAIPSLRPCLSCSSSSGSTATVSCVKPWPGRWGNYAEAGVVPDLLQALRFDNASVRLWSAGSLVDAALACQDQLEPVMDELLQVLQVDGEAAVRSNCAWGLGRLHPVLPAERQRQLEEGLLQALLHDCDSGVRQDARSALEQLEDAELLNRLQMLVEEGLIG